MPVVVGKPPKNSGKSPKERNVSTLAEVQDKIWEAVPPRRHDNRKSYFLFVAEQLGWTPRRVRAYFHDEVRRIDLDEIKTLNRRIADLKAAENRHEEETHAIRESLDTRKPRLSLDGGPPQGQSGEVASSSRVVPGSSD